MMRDEFIGKERNMKEITTEEDLLCDTVELMDIPEPVLLHIMRHLSHHCLRHVVPRVSREWKRLAHSQTLWSQASLECDRQVNSKGGAWNFIRDLLVTPYLQHLKLNMCRYKKVKRSSILAALLSTDCKLHKLTLTVETYGPEILQFLQQHPELRELELRDMATDDSYAAAVAATVGRMASGLTSLVLSQSRLLRLPKAGQLLASPSNGDSDLHGPLCALDLQSVDCDDSDIIIVKRNQPDGLLHLKFNDQSVRVLSSTTHKNLSKLILAHKHTLKRVEVEYFFPEEGGAPKILSECTKLEDLTILCQKQSGFCAMMQSMQSSLRHLNLRLWPGLQAQWMSTVFQTICKHAPKLETLVVDAEIVNQSLFPGFKALRPLLGGKEATLRELSIFRIGPIGRAQILELVSMAASSVGGLSLRKLRVVESCCSFRENGPYGRLNECRLSAMDALKAAAPTLNVILEADVSRGTGCFCHE